MAATEARRSPAARRLLALFLTLLTLAPSATLADEASGTWTGRVETRGSYYWERSTRVVAPTIGGRLDSPSGVAIQAYYLIDSITSASVAAGALVDVGFTELRHETSVSVGGERAIGEQYLQMTGSLRYSQEPDYRAYSGTLATRLSLHERNTVVGLNLTYLHDDVDQVFRTGSQIRPPMTTPGGSGAADFDEAFDGVTSSLYVEQVVNRRLVLTGGYDFGWLSGFLASPYRQVQVDGVLQRESHPELRRRHTLWGRAQLAVPEARGAVHFILRGYSDDWDVRALTTETRWYQQLGEHLLLRLRHRFYTQTASFFESGLAAPSYTGAPRYFTIDPKMQRFHDHELGFGFVTRLGFLAGSGLGWLENAELEFTMDYRFSTNRFGDAVFAALVARVPFE